MPGCREKGGLQEAGRQGTGKPRERVMQFCQKIRQGVIPTRPDISAGIIEPVQVQDLVEDALRMKLGAVTRDGVTVVKDFAQLPVLPLDRGRVLQILVNLVNNTSQAMAGVDGESRRMTLGLEMAQGGRLRITVSDQGEGISRENLSRTLTATSPGAGKGASFSLEIPVESAGGRT